MPRGETWGRVPPAISPRMMSKAPPMARLYPVPTNTFTRLPSPRASREAAAPLRALRIIMPSPMRVSAPLSFPPVFRIMIPANPNRHPPSLRIFIRSLLKKIQARMTTAKTLSEFMMAERAPGA